MNDRHPPLFILLHPLACRRLLGGAFSLLFIMALTHRTALETLSTHIIGGSRGDAGLYFWLTQVGLGRFPIGSSGFETPAFYPYGLTIAWSDNFSLPTLLVSALQALGLSSVSAYNLVILSAIFSSGFFTFALCLSLTNSFTSSLFGGFLFLMAPAVFAQIGHPQLQFTFVFPIIALFSLKFLQAPSISRAILIGGGISLGIVTSVYYAIFSVTLIGAIIGLLVLYRPTVLSFKLARDLLIGVSAGLLPALPLIIPYLKVKSIFGERGLYEMYYFAAKGVSYLSAGPLSLLYGATSSFSPGGESHLFPGLLVAILAGLAAHRSLGAPKLGQARFALLFFILSAGVLSSFISSSSAIRFAASLFAWIALILFGYLLRTLASLERKQGFEIVTNRGLIAVFLGVALISAILSLGPLGNPEKGHWALSPHAALYYLLPGIDAIRAVSRFGIVTVFGLTVAGTLLLAHLIDTHRIKSAILPLIFVLAVADVIPIEIPREPLPLAPGVMRQGWLGESKNGPRDGALVVLPLARELDSNFRVKSWTDFAGVQVEAMLASYPLGFSTVNGHSGQRPKLLSELPMSLRNFPSDRAIRELAQICALRYIVYRGDLVRGFNEAEFLENVRLMPRSIRLITQETDDSFLFEFIHQLKVTAPVELLCPPNGTMQLEFEAQRAVGSSQEQAELTVEHVASAGASPLARIPLPPDGAWKSIGIALPQSQDGVRPLNIRFSSAGEHPLYIRNQRIVPLR